MAKIKLISSGVKELLHDNDIYAVCEELANQLVAIEAQDGNRFEVVRKDGKKRSWANIETSDYLTKMRQYSQPNIYDDVWALHGGK